MSSINPIYNINYAQAPTFKAKGVTETAPVTNPIPSSNLSFKGTEALAAYNYAKINQNKAFDIPVLERFEIPKDINKIKGERITNSAGELVRIIDEDDKQKTQYYINGNEVLCMSKLEKDTGILWNQQFDMITKKYPDGTSYDTMYQDGELFGKSKHITYPNGDDIHIHFDAIEKQYSVSKHYTKNGHVYSSFADYDKNKKCIDARESRGINDKISNLSFINGEPYKISTQEATLIPHNFDKSQLDLTGLELDEPIDINLDIKNIQGHKKYYSNGQIEQIITPDGKIYNFGLDGLESAQIGNKEYQIMNIFGNGYYGQSIITNLDNGVTKTTNINKLGESVFIDKNDECIKSVNYYENGSISSYSNDSVMMHFDKNGNITEYWDTKNQL